MGRKKYGVSSMDIRLKFIQSARMRKYVCREFTLHGEVSTNERILFAMPCAVDGPLSDEIYYKRV